MNPTNKRLLSFRGKEQSLSEWARELNFKRITLKYRLDDLGWSVEKAFTTPTGPENGSMKPGWAPAAMRRRKSEGKPTPQRLLREQANISQVTMIERVDASPVTVMRYEQDAESVSPEVRDYLDKEYAKLRVKVEPKRAKKRARAKKSITKKRR